jgi:ankyrin repeat protein/tetratricopeptide (TPR) repeat protein
LYSEKDAENKHEDNQYSFPLPREPSFLDISRRPSLSSISAKSSFSTATSSDKKEKETAGAKLTIIERANLLKKYQAFLSLVENDHMLPAYATSPPPSSPLPASTAGYLSVQPQQRFGPWLLQFVEEAYDARFKFEYSSWREGPPKRDKTNSRGASAGTGLDTGDLNAGTFEKVEQHRSPVDFSLFLHTYVSTRFGLKSLVRQVCWDICLTLEATNDPEAIYDNDAGKNLGAIYLEESRIFSLFLRGVYNWKTLLFFLFARNAVQSLFRVQISARRDKLLDEKFVQRALPAEYAKGSHVDHSEFELLRVMGSTREDQANAFAALVVIDDHPVLGEQWRVVRLSQLACKTVCERLFHKNKVLAEFLFELLLTEEGPGGNGRGAVSLNGIRCYGLLVALLEDFRAIPDEFLTSMSEDDTAETVVMLQGLKEASGSDKRVAELTGEIKEQMLVVASHRNEVMQLERNNDDNGNRTSIFLARNKLWRQEQVLQAYKKSLRAIIEHEDAAWSEVIAKSDASIRQVKLDRERRRPPSVPADLFNLGEVVELMHAWSKQRLSDHNHSMAVLSRLKPVSVEEQMEKLRLKSVIRLQRQWRERVAARIAKYEAEMFLEVKRRQRDAKIAERKRREEAIRKRREAAEKKKKAAMEAKLAAERAKEQEMVRLRALARQQLLDEDIEQRFKERRQRTVRRCYMKLQRHAKSRVLRRKVFRSQMQSRVDRWCTFTKDSKARKRLEQASAATIQRFGRMLIARDLLHHARRKHAERESIVRHFLRKLLNAHAHKAFLTWHDRARQIRGSRNMLRRRFMSSYRHCWDVWFEALLEGRQLRRVKATKLQAQYRAKMERRSFAVKLRKHRAASTIQRMARARAAKKILRRAKARKRRDERRVLKSLKKIQMHLESRVLLSWYTHVKTLKKMRRFVRNNLRAHERTILEVWHTWASQQASVRDNAARVMQRRWRSHTAIRLTRNLLRKTRAATIIQTSVRQYLEVDTLDWLLLYRDAAIEVGRVVRGHLARVKYVKRRIANYFVAAEKGDYWTCNKAFERGEGFSQDDYGDNILMCAARGGSKRICKLALRKGMDANMSNTIGLTALHHLCRATYIGQEILLDYLLSKGCKANSVDFTGATPLVDAARLGHMECVTKLVECHADVDHRDNDGCSVVQIAAAANQLGIVAFLAHECDCDVENVDNSGCNVLHDVSTRGKWRMLQAVIPHCYNLDVQDANGQTPLHLAVFGKHRECVRFLVLAEADSNIIDNYGRTPLHHACFQGSTDIANLICEGDTDLTMRDEDGDTALHAAAVSGHEGLAEILLGFGADHSIRNDNGDQPAHLAARKGHTAVLRLLINYECDVNMKNFQNRTPLGEARVNCHPACVALFNRLFTDGAEAAAKVKREKRKLAFLNGKEHLLTDADKEETEAERRLREDPGYEPHAARREEDWVIPIPTIDKQWVKMRKKSVLQKRMHKWQEYAFSDNVALKHGNEIRAQKYKRLGRPAPEVIWRCVFWYNTETQATVVNPPDDVVFGIWLYNTENVETKRIDPATGEIVATMTTRAFWLNDLTGVRHDGDMPPQHVKTRRPRKLRVLAHMEDADVSSTEYEKYWKQEMSEGMEKRSRLKAAKLIQRHYRAYCARVGFTRLKLHTAAAIQMQKVCRGFLGRIRAKHRKIKIRAVTTVQRSWRGRLSRLQLGEMKIHLERRRSILRAAAAINRVWRGYLPRRFKRRILWRRDGPQFHDQWMELVEYSTVRRIVGVWDEMIVGETWDVLFYHNHINNAVQWDKPEAVEKTDIEQWEDDRMLRISGYTRAELQAASWLQGIWRGRMIRATFRLMVRGARIMRTCADKYLSNPDDPVALCNYVLYLHVGKRDYNKARPLYARCLSMMSERGPDNAFILFAYAMFVTATREEDFGEVMNYVRRAHAANKNGANRFSLAEKGFFRQVAVLNPRNGQACANYAICLQFLRFDYDKSEEWYIKACDADPYDAGIVENFNNMLKRMAGKQYDGFDAFRKYQAEKAAVEAEEQARILEIEARIKDKEEIAHRHRAANVIRAMFYHKVKHIGGSAAKVWRFSPPEGMKTSAPARSAAAPASALSAARAVDDLNGLVGNASDQHLENHEHWEECSDGLGGTYFHCFRGKRAGESVWVRPNFRDQTATLRQGAGFDGIRGGALEDIEDWEECSDDSGKHYYFCVKTNRSQWVRPRFRQNGILRRGVGFGDAHVAVADAEKSGKHLSKKKKEQLLGKPEYQSEWEQHEGDTGSGKKFWWNKVTSESRWLKPNFMSEREEKEARRREKEKTRRLKEEEGAQLKESGSSWEVCFVENSADAYYYNTTTGESVWELDVETECKLAAATSAMSHLDTETNQAEEEDRTAATTAAYNPADWEPNHTETGDAYWYNVVTGESVWTDPAQL